MKGIPIRHPNERHAHERHAHGMDAYARHAMRDTPMEAPERGSSIAYTSLSPYPPAEKEQLEPFYKLLESQRRRQRG